jgi:regulation of enolase protein 1 (concanavalin A-like superfamily)
MFTKKRLIMAVVLVVATIMIVIAVAIVAGILFLRSSGDTVAMPGATAVGVPKGPATTKSIGPAGGSLASSDGRITIDVPPNAVTAAVDFRITPITNLGKGGVGSAYRLEPNEQKFATPVKVSFKYDAEGFKDAAPESFAVAYQDPTGVWQALKTSNIDWASKTVSISTTHFTDWSLWTIRLEPEKVTIRVGEKVHIEPIQCLKPTSLYQRFQDFIGNQPCIALWPQTKSWSVNIGTLSPITAGVIYTAPATKPSPNVAIVRFVYHLRGESSDVQEVRECEITIVDRGYKASGNTGDIVWSGEICSLEEHFTVTGNNGLFLYPFKFVPSSATAGTWSFHAKWKILTAEGGGSYTIEGADTDKPKILMKGSSSGTIPVGTLSRGETSHIDLVPLDKECKP